jgi:hypothetical protein
VYVGCARRDGLVQNRVEIERHSKYLNR